MKVYSKFLSVVILSVYPIMGNAQPSWFFQDSDGMIVAAVGDEFADSPIEVIDGFEIIIGCEDGRGALLMTPIEPKNPSYVKDQVAVVLEEMRTWGDDKGLSDMNLYVFRDETEVKRLGILNTNEKDIEQAEKDGGFPLFGVTLKRDELKILFGELRAAKQNIFLVTKDAGGRDEEIRIQLPATGSTAAANFLSINCL